MEAESVSEHLVDLQHYYDYLLSHWKAIVFPDLPDLFDIDDEERHRVYSVIFAVQETVGGFLPSYIRNQLPIRLIKVDTMEILSTLSERFSEYMENWLHQFTKRCILDLMSMDLTVDKWNYLQQAIASNGWYSILSHKWGAREVIYSDMQIFSTITRHQVKNIIARCKNDNHYLKGRSLLSEITITLQGGPTSLSNQTLDDIKISSLFELVNLPDADSKTNDGLKKLIQFCYLSYTEHSINFAWIDTCCIDKTSSAELDESIRSMFRWYKNSIICIVHLGSTELSRDLALDPWFTRGWTLQELLAPRRVKFYNKDWKALSKQEGVIDEINKQAPGIIDMTSTNPEIDFDTDEDLQQEDSPRMNENGDKGLLERISEITCVPIHDLLNFRPGLRNVRRRLQWTANRETTRIEDEAYCLLGIFDVSIPIAYGEGQKALHRLQAAIIEDSNDLNIFLWCGGASSKSSMLAKSTRCFSTSFTAITKYLGHSAQFGLTNHGLSISVLLYGRQETLRWITSVQEFESGLDQHYGFYGAIEEPRALDIDEANVQTVTYRLAILGYDKRDSPVFMLLQEHYYRGARYYRREPWQPRALDFYFTSSPDQLPQPSTVFIR